MLMIGRVFEGLARLKGSNHDGGLLENLGNLFVIPIKERPLTKKSSAPGTVMTLPKSYRVPDICRHRAVERRGQWLDANDIGTHI